MRRAADLALLLVAGTLLAGLLAKAARDVPGAWDDFYYHLPFAARLWGILPASAYVFRPENAARLAGFPLLGELLQGAMWRLFGRPEGASFVALGALGLFVLFLRRRYAVPMRRALVALLAVPLVQTHAVECYVDLPAGLAAAALVLIAFDVHRAAAVSARTLLFAATCGAVAANMRFQLNPLVAVSLMVIAWRADLRGRALLLLLAPLVFFTAVKNTWVHGNPAFPVALSLLGHPLPAVEEPYASSPPWLAHAPQPLRFVASLLEMGARPLEDARRWTVDQWMPADAAGYRMGGFFHAYVLALIATLVAAGRRARPVCAAIALLTVLIAVMPQSHELRYYLAWMIALVALALVHGDRRHVDSASVLALAIVLASTRAAYVRPLGIGFAEVLRDQVDAATLREIHEGEHVCLAREPWTPLYAAPFHPGRRYVVHEAATLADCAGARFLP